MSLNEKIENVYSHIGTQIKNTQNEESIQFDFDARLTEIHIFFPSGQNGTLHLFFQIEGMNVLKNLKNSSALKYVCGDAQPFDLKPQQPIRRGQVFSIITDNVDAVNDHQYFIWFTIKKEAL